MAVAATGFFDGVHLGHRAVIDTLLSSSRSRGEESVVVTFWPHPRIVFQNGARDLKLLQPLEKKVETLQALGVDKVKVMPFEREFASLTAREYLEMLRERFGVDFVVLGHDNRFGSDGLSTSQIAELAGTMDMGIEIVPPFIYGGAAVSSTRVRTALENGDVEGAAEMLCHPYEISGVVVPGKQMGRTIAFPTANMALFDPLSCVPGPAAYLSEVEVDGEKFTGMTNVDRSFKIETNIFDFSRDIYGHHITVRFLRKLRGEIRFNSFEELRMQLLKDRAHAIELSEL